MKTAFYEMRKVLEEIVGQEKPNKYGYDAASMAMDNEWRKRARKALAKAKEEEAQEGA